MKKLICFSLLLVFVIMCGCGKAAQSQPDSTVGSTDSSTTASTQKTASDSHQKIHQAAERVKNGNMSSFEGYSDEELEKIVEAVEEDGYSLEIQDDGSGILSNEEGEWIIAKGWVENEYTKGVEPVNFGEITMSLEDEDSQGKYYMFLIRNADFLEVENYVETLCQTGFDNVTDKVINHSGKMIVFTAENDQGKKASIGYSSNGFTLKLTK